MKYLKILVISICLLISSCAPYQRVIVNPESLKVRRTHNIKVRHHFMFLGVGQTKVINAKEYCDEDGLQLGYVDFVHNYWMEFFTATIYSPKKMIIHCFKKK